MRKRLDTMLQAVKLVRARLEEYRAIGLDEIILGALDDAPSIAAALAAARG